MNRLFALVTLFCVTLSSMAHAELFLLFEHKAWQVHYDSGTGSPNGVPYCTASVDNNDLYLSIDVDAQRNVSVYVIDETKRWVTSNNTVVYGWVDRHNGWNIENVYRNDKTVKFNLLGEAGGRFLQEIISGSTFYFDYNETNTPPGEWDVSFTLYGSSAAIQALADCMVKL